MLILGVEPAEHPVLVEIARVENQNSGAGEPRAPCGARGCWAWDWENLTGCLMFMVMGGLYRFQQNPVRLGYDSFASK